MTQPGLSSAVEVQKGIDLFSMKSRHVLTHLLLLAGLGISLLVPQSLAAQDAWKSPDWLMTPAQTVEFGKREYLKVKGNFRAATLSGEQARQVRTIVHYYLSQLVHNSDSDMVKTVDKFFQSEMSSLTSPAARQVLMEEVAAKVPDLLNHPKDLVRYNALSMAVQLNVRPGRVVNLEEIPAVPFAPAHKMLIPVIKDKDQQMACRILAAKGLARICKDGDGTPSAPDRSDIAQAAVDTLNAIPPSKDDGIWWFRSKLIEVLGSVDRIDNISTQPIVIEALLDVITNRNERPSNRALAAQSITQLPFTSTTNVPLITDEIMKLLGEFSTAFLRTPTAAQGWHEPFVRLYLAFRPATTRQAKELKWGLLYQVERPGLSSHAAYVKGAWAVAFPILRPFIEKGPTPPVPNDVKALTEWLNKIEPANRKVVPNGKEYSAKVAVVVKDAGGE